MKSTLFLKILLILAATNAWTAFCQEDTTSGKWLSNQTIDQLLYFAEKGEVSIVLVPELQAQIKDLKEKIEIHELKSSDLETFNDKLIEDNTELNQKLLKSKKSGQIFKALTVSFGSIVLIETIIIIFSIP